MFQEFDRPRPRNIVKPDDIRAPAAEIVTTIVVVRNAKERAAIVRPLMAPIGQMNALADRNALYLVDRAANARRLVGIIRDRDKLPAFKAE